MNMYKSMTEDEREVVRNFEKLLDSWIKGRQESVRMLEDDYAQTEEIVMFTKKVIKDIYFMHHIRVQLGALWKRRG